MPETTRGWQHWKIFVAGLARSGVSTGVGRSDFSASLLSLVGTFCLMQPKRKGVSETMWELDGSCCSIVCLKVKEGLCMMVRMEESRLKVSTNSSKAPEPWRVTWSCYMCESTSFQVQHSYQWIVKPPHCKAYVCLNRNTNRNTSLHGSWTWLSSPQEWRRWGTPPISCSWCRRHFDSRARREPADTIVHVIKGIDSDQTADTTLTQIKSLSPIYSLLLYNNLISAIDCCFQGRSLRHTASLMPEPSLYLLSHHFPFPWV